MPHLFRPDLSYLNPIKNFRRSTAALYAAHDIYFKGMQSVVESWHAPVGLMPKQEVWRLNKARLYRYLPVKAEDERHPIPLILVYALINKPFIFDLGPGRSFIEYMLEQGFDVYLLDWGKPGPEDYDLNFDEYVTDYLSRAVRKMLRVSGANEFSMMGYCLGATLATVYAAYYYEAPLRNLILLTAPLDFSEEDGSAMTVWLRAETLDIDRLIAAYGNIPGQLIEMWAKMLKPLENFFGSYASLWNMLDNEEAVHGWQAINRWVEDVVPVTGGAMRQFVREYVRNNELVTGQHKINGQKLNLQNIKANLLNIIAQYDHLVDPKQSKSIMELVSSKDKTLTIIPSTHVGIMAGRRAKYRLWPELATWLSSRSNVLMIDDNTMR